MTRASTPNEIRGPGGALPLRPGDAAAVSLAMLIEGETSGRPLDEVLAEFGFSRSTYYAKLKRYLDEGVRGLLPRAPGPRAPWRRTQALVRRVLAARLAAPDASAATIARDLAREGWKVSERSIEWTLRELFADARPR